MVALRGARGVLSHIASGGLLIVGVVVLATAAHSAGFDATTGTLRQGLVALPWLLAVEALRIGTELMATRSLLGSARAPAHVMVRAHLIPNAISQLVPLGRLAAEATRATLLGPSVGLPRAAAAAVASQSLHLVASGIVLIACVVATVASRAAVAAGLTTAFAGQAAILLALGLTFWFSARTASQGHGWLARKVGRLGTTAGAVQHALQALPVVPFEPLGWLLANRALQVAELAIAMRVVGADTPVSPLVAEGVLLLASSIGDVVPGQIGALEAAFALASASLGASRSAAITTALLLHLAQAAWVATGCAVPLVTGVLARIAVRPTTQRPTRGARPRHVVVAPPIRPV